MADPSGVASVEYKVHALPTPLPQAACEAYTSTTIELTPWSPVPLAEAGMEANTGCHEAGFGLLFAVHSIL